MNTETHEIFFETWINDKSEMDLDELPSWELRALAKDLIKKNSDDLLQNLRAPNLEILRNMACASLMLSEGRVTRKYSRKMFGLAFDALENLINAHPNISTELLTTVGVFIGASQAVIAGNTAERHKNFSARINPLSEKNAKASERSERARSIASAIWAADSEHEYRLSDMATEVKDILEREGVQNLPQIERIKEWIKQVAPEYARRPGRGKSPRT